MKKGFDLSLENIIVLFLLVALMIGIYLIIKGRLYLVK